VRLYLLCEQMTFDIGHDELKVQHGYETGAALVRPSEAFDGVLFVKIVKKLTELAVRHQTFFVATKIQLYEW
jgi:hypothetical protein